MSQLLIDLLQEGYTKQQISDALAKERGFSAEDLRKEGFNDAEIISNVLGTGALDAFANQFTYNAAESALGIAQAADWMGANTFDKERAKAMSEAADILSEGHGIAKWTGIISGSIADPIGIPASFLKFIKAATLTKQLAKQGSAQGVFGGALQPSYAETPEEIAKDKAKSTTVGAIFGAGLGAGIGKGLSWLTNKQVKVAEEALAPEQKAVDDAVSSVISADKEITAKTEAQKVEQAVQETVPNEIKITGADISTRPLSDAEEGIIKQRINVLEDQISQLRWKEVEGTPPTTQEAQKEVAALFRGKEKAPDQPADNLPPVPGAGLVSPQKAAEGKQTPALFQPKPQEPTPVIQVQKDAPKTAALLRSQGIDSYIKIREQQIALLQEQLYQSEKRKAAMQQPEMVQVETRKGPAPVQQQAVQQPAPPVFDKQQATASITKAMEETGAKNTDDLIIKTGRPDEVAAAQARIDQGIPPRSVEQIVDDLASEAMRGVGGSLSARAAKPEQIFSDLALFPRAPIAAKNIAAGKAAPDMTREPVSVPELERQMKDVGFFEKDFNKILGGGSLAELEKQGLKLVREARKEEGSYLNWLFKEENGKYVNVGEGWTGKHIAAFAPVVKYATDLKSKLLDDAASLKRQGKFDAAAKAQLVQDLNFPIQVLGLFQQKRTEASRYLNSFKTLRNHWEKGGQINGFMRPGSTC